MTEASFWIFLVIASAFLCLLAAWAVHSNEVYDRDKKRDKKELAGLESDLQKLN